jgi:hypothetical protein
MVQTAKDIKPTTQQGVEHKASTSKVITSTPSVCCKERLLLCADVVMLRSWRVPHDAAPEALPLLVMISQYSTPGSMSKAHSQVPPSLISGNLQPDTQ